MNKKNLLGNTIAVIVMCLVMAAVFGRIWANQQRLDVPMLWHGVQSADGNIYIVIGKQLFVETPSGENVEIIPLESLGIRDFNGAMLPMPGGDIVMAAGHMVEMNFNENLRRFQRKVRRSDAPTDTLQRCDFKARKCEFLSGTDSADRVFQPGRAFGLSQGPGETLLATDSGIHTIFLLASDGRILDSRRTGFEFPNEIHLVAENEVMVVDTNHHRLAHYSVTEKGFGEKLTERSILGWPGVEGSQRFPFAWARTADGAEWTLIANSGMDDAILVRSEAGRQREIALPRGSDSVDFIATPDRLLVLDQGLDRILSFTHDGRTQPDFGSEKLQFLLADHASQRKHFQSLSENLLVALVLMGCLCLPLALLLLLKRYKREASDNLRSISEAPGDALHGSLGAQDASALLDGLAGRYHFVRGAIIDGRDATRLKILSLIAFSVLFTTYLLVQHEKLQLMLDEFEHPSMLFMAFLFTFVAAVAMAVYACFRESLWIDPQGIHYVSPLPSPFTGLMPGWSIPWQEVDDIGLTYIRSPRQPLLWNLVIRTTYGERKHVRALQWRLVGANEPGLRLFELTRLTEGRIRKAIQQRMLYRALATQMQRLRMQRKAVQSRSSSEAIS